MSEKIRQPIAIFERGLTNVPTTMLTSLTNRPPGSAHRSLDRSRSWRSVRLDDAASVAELNGLLRKGWFVIAVNAGGLSFLSPATTTALPGPSTPEAPGAVDVVLADGALRDRQSALFVGRTGEGPADPEALPARLGGWARMLTVLLRSGDAVVLYERVV